MSSETFKMVGALFSYLDKPNEVLSVIGDINDDEALGLALDCGQIALGEPMGTPISL